jgi:hypothetical protein
MAYDLNEWTQLEQARREYVAAVAPAAALLNRVLAQLTGLEIAVKSVPFADDQSAAAELVKPSVYRIGEQLPEVGAALLAVEKALATAPETIARALDGWTPPAPEKEEPAQ